MIAFVWHSMALSRRLQSLAIRRVILGIVILGVSLSVLSSIGAVETAADPQQGYRFLTEKAYLPPDFDQETFDAVWQVWPEPLRTQASNASIATRRQMAMQRYGLTPRPDSDVNAPFQAPLQYVVSADGQWSMNCFACHGGQVENRVVPGAPNREFALETLTSEIRQTKLKLGKRLSHMDVGSLFMPLGTTRGTTNAVMFGVALLAYRAPDLSLLPKRLPPSMTHHDMDAPPWWHVHRKQNLYIDGFAPQGHRPLMQFMLVEQNGPAQFADWEKDFRHVEAYIQSLRPPRYPQALDSELAKRGQIVFESHCAECHGTYGEARYYPERRVPWEEVGTDRVRLKALTVQQRQRYAESWFAEGHSENVTTAPDGYVAPPLDGIWATAPYFHNGSVPTLWHLLRPSQRPQVWHRSSDSIDFERVGLTVVATAADPAVTALRPQATFDTRKTGKSALGHDFADRLSEQEKVELLEYLKTL